MFFDLLFIALFLFSSYLFYFLLHRLPFGLMYLNPDNFVISLCYLYSMPGIFILYFGLDNFHSDFLKVNDKTVIFEVLVLNVLNILFIILGMTFVRKILRKKLLKIDFSKIIEVNRFQKLGLFSFTLLSFAFLVVYLLKVDSIAIVELFNGGAIEATVSRSKMTNSFNGSYFIYATFFQELGFFLLIVSFIRYLHSGKKWLLFFLLNMNIFVSLMAIQKGPLLNLIIYLFITWICVKRGGLFELRHVFLSVATVMGLATFIFSLFLEFDSLSQAFSAVVMRAFSGSISPGYFYLKYYPSVSDFLFGRSIPNPFGILPYTPVNYSWDVFNYMYPTDSLLQDAVGSAPIAIWGEAYANFGIIGVPIVAFLFGVYFSTLTSFVSRLQHNPINLGFYVYSMYHFSISAVVGFSYFLIDFFLLIVLIVFLLLNLFSGKISFHKTTRSGSNMQIV